MKNEKYSWVYDLIFILVLIMASYLRIAGYNWGEGQHQHPDELFLSGVLDNLRAKTCIDESLPIDACPPDQQGWMTISQYFDSSTSTLNPYVRGHAFFVYGNLPMTLTRVLYEIASSDEAINSKYFARQVSGIADLFTVFLLYLIASKLYGRKIGLFAATFSALAVMQIQQAHFFTSDTFVLMFMTLTLWFAVSIVSNEKEVTSEGSNQLSANSEQLSVDSNQSSVDSNQLSDNSPVSSLQSQITNYEIPKRSGVDASRITHYARNPLFLLTIGFGIALGMAMASKINAGAMAFVLPFAFLVRYLIYDKNKKLNTEYWTLILALLITGGLATIISFRIFQPYAFDGIGLNDQWVSNIAEQRVQAKGIADLPWNLQWARRSHLYSFENLTTWGLGLPLGILAWIGFIVMAWRIFKGEYKHLLLWGWTAFYFTWQSMQFNPTMRYQLPIYPLLCMMAAWVIYELLITNSQSRISNYALRITTTLVGITVLISTTIWAFAFQSIYLREETRMQASRWLFQNAPAGINVLIESENETLNQPLPVSPQLFIAAENPYLINFTPRQDGELHEIKFGHALDASGLPTEINLTLYNASQPDLGLAHASVTLDSSLTTDPRGPSLTFKLDKVIPLVTTQQYIIKIETTGTGLSIIGSNIANETDYDYGLPFRVDTYDAFGGIFNGEYNLQVYWNDDPAKVARFIDVLSNSDYIVIPTNHQYGQITRLPERYPLTTLYYRELIGCPTDQEIIECYRLAQPDTYTGNLGYELVEVFESYPTFGNVVINDQRAEEAFTFYDHPKVLIFKKSENFDVNKVTAILNTVDLTKVVQLTPTQFDDYKTLLLPESRLISQRAGGTWSQLFDYDWIQNKYPWLGVVYWYVFIFLLGLVAYPIARLALPGLKQYAYPLGRIVGILLLAWLAWMSGSVGLGYTRLTISIAFVLIAGTGIGLYLKRKAEYKSDWDTNRKFFVIAEIVFLSFFLIDLLIRLGNPDLWHPSKGGERPMDFSYFNAVLKSTSFPAYDPWFAGGYINYYYYGFVLAGTPVKLLGIVPSIAYNFILPTWFALVAIGAFGIGYSLVSGIKFQVSGEDESVSRNLSLISGLSASLLTIFLGNLGTIQFIINSIQRVALQGAGVPAETGMFERWRLTFQGLWKMFSDQVALPIGRGDWYWFPSRVVPPGPGNEITEFPLFTFLYSDMHAHMLVMPLVLFIIAWSLSFIISRAKLTRAEWITSFFISALMIGALKPTNTWDLYTYYLLAAIAMGYTIYRNVPLSVLGRGVRGEGQKIFLVFASAILLYGLSSLFYYPFTHWWGQAYNSVQYWDATRTPLGSYFTQWGLFLFIIFAWLIWETRQWMAATPVSKLNSLRKYVLIIEIALAGFIALLIFFLADGVGVGLIALPLALWSAILMLRADLPDTKRFVLFLVGTALTITIVVEVFTLVGDIGRQNTIFKFYLQAWMMLAVSAASASAWLLNDFSVWKSKWRNMYQVGLYILLAGAFMFTLTGTSDKIADRMNPDAPHSLDSMEYMNHSELWDGQIMNLSEDYRAIRWLQDNVVGSPVIVEANCSEYRWCTRMTINTGLPSVVGWNFHQRQQRGIFAPQVQERVDQVGMFYNTTDIQLALDFLKKYDVKYIIVGQLERNIYPVLPELPDGLAKFNEYDGVYWKAVYQNGDTTIYEVIP